ncbi:hypothetical protein LTS18_006112 [Coniosporium uncinatum]|uniref:Uncharacterized protein n=1 Tax=Coniosporium uncinatum TaxID=93489 RepID=A0ACC3DAV1_9PEZI|nr:hypothetical protein LTS18_006112 [Coniosporium uncinatum]
MRLVWLLACTATLFTYAEARYGPLIHESAQHAEQPPSPFSYREQGQLPLPLAHDAKKELLHLHRKLVQIESITGNEYEVGTWLASYLESHNLTVEKLEVAPNRFNVFAYPGTEKKTKVLVSSHIDTVPPFIPYTLRNHGTELWGRGSVDAKACVAAQTIAALNIFRKAADAAEQEMTTAPSLGLLFVVGEETTGDGMKHFSATRPHDFPSVIFGEPTEGKLVSGHKGIFGFKVVIKGKAAHSGYPWLGLSANNAMVEALAALLKLEEKLPSSEKYGKTTLNIGKVEGGVAANVVAERAEAVCAVRMADGTPEEILNMVTDALEPIRKKLEGEDGSLEIGITISGYPPVDIDTDIDGFETMTVNYGTDVPNLDGVGKRYLYGPGSIFVAHGANEHLKVEELEAAVGDYEKLIQIALEREDELRAEETVVEKFWQGHTVEPVGEL